jgi:hypothetical protein
MKTGYADLPLHGGRAPSWLFERMKRLARHITTYIVSEFGTGNFIERFADPFWFQSFGCLLGFDWHSSGLTTTVLGALKEGIKEECYYLGVFVAGGKGRIALKTPEEIETIGLKTGIDAERLIYASRMSARVDNAAVQDGFNLYHHVIIFDLQGNWSVVQQGMNEKTGYARRYHWYSGGLSRFVEEPHAAVCSDIRVKTLNMVARESKQAREAVVHIATEKPEKVLVEIKRLQSLVLPREHRLSEFDLKPDSFKKVLLKTYERQPQDFEQLLEIQGAGPKTLRALALLAELIYGAKPSFRDPAKFSFAHGGKDGYPYPVDRKTYDQTIETLERAVKTSSIENSEKIAALKRLYKFYRH